MGNYREGLSKFLNRPVQRKNPEPKPGLKTNAYCCLAVRFPGTVRASGEETLALHQQRPSTARVANHIEPRVGVSLLCGGVSSYLAT